MYLLFLQHYHHADLSMQEFGSVVGRSKNLESSVVMVGELATRVLHCLPRFSAQVVADSANHLSAHSTTCSANQNPTPCNLSTHKAEDLLHRLHLPKSRFPSGSTSTLIQQVLQGTHLKIINITGDGHCFYRAISQAISGHQGHYPNLRQLLHSHMTNNPHLCHPFFSSSDYLDSNGPINRKNSAQWATDIEIFYMSHLLVTPIRVYKRRDLDGWHLFHPNFIDPDCHVDDTECLYLSNTNNDHFDVVSGTGHSNLNTLCASPPADTPAVPNTPLSHIENITANKEDFLHIGLFNTRGLITNNINKCNYIYNSLHNQDTHIMCITETWLQEKTNLPSEISSTFSHHCVPHRADRDLTLAAIGEDGAKQSRGGCANISSSKVPSEELGTFSNGDVELVISYVPMLKLYVCNIYRPSSATLAHFTEAMDYLTTILNAATDSNSNIILVGDFNFPDFTWESHDGVTIPVYNPHLQSQEHLAFKKLIDVMNKFNLMQMVDKPTRLDNTLDLVFSNDPDSILEVIVHPVPGSISDHNFINIVTPPPAPPPPAPPSLFATFDFPNADHSTLQPELEKINWDDVINPDMTTAEVFDAITEATSTAALNAGVPRRDPTQVSTNKPKYIKKLWRKKCSLVRKVAANPNLKEELAPTVKDVEVAIQSYFADKDDNAESKAVSSLKDSPSSFFAFVNSKRKERSHIGPLKEVRNGVPHYIYDPKRMADILSKQYTSVFSKPVPDKKVVDPSIFFNTELPNHINSLTDIVFNPDDIEEMLKELKITAANGPKGWSAYLLHKYSNIFAAPIYTLWRKSLDSGDMPEGVNLAFVSPLFKGGDKSDPANYRPIALTSHLTKTFERLVRKKLIEHLAHNNLINKTQHGFVAGRSTMTQLIHYYTTILDSMINLKQVDVIYLDFAKAFDKCDHGIIDHKLRSFGIGKCKSMVTFPIRNGLYPVFRRALFWGPCFLPS